LASVPERKESSQARAGDEPPLPLRSDHQVVETTALSKLRVNLPLLLNLHEGAGPKLAVSPDHLSMVSPLPRVDSPRWELAAREDVPSPLPAMETRGPLAAKGTRTLGSDQAKEYVDAVSIVSAIV